MMTASVDKKIDMKIPQDLILNEKLQATWWKRMIKFSTGKSWIIGYSIPSCQALNTYI